MTQAIVLHLPTAMASARAITHDVLATANRIRAAAGRPEPFAVVEARCSARSAWSGSIRRGDVVILPGLGCTGADELRRDLAAPATARARELLLRAASSGAVVAAGCASAFVLAGTGLLDGRAATTTWWFAPAFARMFPEVDLQADRIVVSDGRFVTGGAAMAQVDLMLALVGRLAGPELAGLCARYLVLDERRSQSPYMTVSALAAGDESLAKAERWVRRHMARNFDVAELAAAVAMSPRTLARRLSAACGTNPSRFVQKVRVEAAASLLASTDLSVEEVSSRVGYADASTLRRILRRETGRSPSGLRRSRQLSRP